MMSLGIPLMGHADSVAAGFRFRESGGQYGCLTEGRCRFSRFTPKSALVGHRCGGGHVVSELPAHV
jgi:hypothetical protein